MKSEVVRARIEPDIKLLAESVLSEIGMTPSDAIRLLFSQIALRGSFPLELQTSDQANTSTKQES